MIGLMILAVIVAYILLAKFIVNKVYKITNSIKKKNIAIAIMILIPTWDVILGAPIYAYLCIFESGVKIYKTVEDVEGFYIGERSIGSEPIEPYEGYKYVDYQEVKNNKSTGKYYRSYWVDYFKDREMANMCVYPPYPKSLHHPYTKAFNNGKCIVKEEIDESEVSQWEYDTTKNIQEVVVPIVKIERTIVAVKDRNQNQNIAENIRYNINQNWVIGIMNESINTRGVLAFCSMGKNMLEKVLRITNQKEK